MDIIKQTNRTILFEEINPEKLNLITLIGDVEGINSLSDDKVEEINKHLLVSSFEEFLEKFDPCIYSYFDTQSQKICYSLEKNKNIPDELVNVISLGKDNNFLKMLLTLIDTRKSNKVKNVNFDYEDILELLSPKRVIEDLKQSRKEISYLFEKYEKLDDRNPEKKDIGDKLNYRFLEASKNYNNVLAMLPLAIEDIEVRLLSSRENGKKNNIEKIKAGILSIGASGNLEVIEIQSSSNLLEVKNSNENSNKLATYFKDDYDESVKVPSEYVKNLVARSFVPLSDDLIEIDEDIEKENYDNYITLYKDSQEDFIKISKELIKKILGIKLYFDQYDVKSWYMKPKLLISNINSNLLTNPKNKQKLEVYLNTVNNKNDFTNTIWFAILANVNFETRIENEKIKKRFISSEEEDLIEKNKFLLLQSLAGLLEKYKIQLFFNFQANDKTDFKTFAIKGLDEYKEKTKILENQSYSEYVILCAPNFTIIPKNKSRVQIGKKIKDDKDLDFYINGIYIDASYVAAGLVCAYQCPYYLKERFKNVDMVNPGVRINIEDSDNNFEIISTMPKEISGYTQDIKNRINESNFGFIFSSENAVNNGKILNNILVYKARSMNKNSKYNYEPIYKTLISTYIERVIRYETMDFKADKINYFFSSSPDSKKSQWLKNITNVNSILKAQDDMTHSIDIENNTCSLNLMFSGDVKHLNLFINSKE